MGLHRPYFHLGGMSAVDTSYTPAQIASFYSFPKVTSGPEQKIAVIELGGGYDANAINSLFTQWGLPHPIITDLSVGGAANSYSGNPSSADGEVILDIVVAAAAYSHCTGTPANIVVVFAPNSNQGFVDAVNTLANGNVASTCGISWGSAENNWGPTAIQQMDAAFAKGVANGVTFCVASGDAGSGDGGQGNNADYPGSSPYVVCCGGTTIMVQNNAIVNEVVWNVGGGATGGGFSSVEQVPSWQKGFVPVGRLRGVPDLCADADPATGYITPFGPIGGTSAVAPLMAAYFAVCNKGLNKRLGLVNPLLYANEPDFKDIVQGNNGSFSATQGWDAASGLGSPIGTKLINSFAGNPTPPTPPTPGPGPTEVQVIAAIDRTFAVIETQTPPWMRSVLNYINIAIDQAVHQLYASSVTPMEVQAITGKK